MRFLRYRSIFYLGCALILAMVVYDSAIAAFAGAGPAKVTVKSGALSLSGPASVTATSVILNGKTQTSTYTLPLTLIDARGSAAGWKLTITSTTFTSGSNKLANNASSIGSLTVTCNAHSTCTLPNNSIHYPLAVPAGTTPPAAVTFFNAAAKSGLGSFTITPKVSISVPSSTKVGTYMSTLSVAIGTGQPIHVTVSLSVQKKDHSPDAPVFFSVNYMLALSLNNPGSTNWHLSITSTQFALASTPTYTLPTTASSIMSASTCQTQQNCADNVVAYPIALPAGNPAPNPVTFYAATANAGVGTFNVTATITIVVPVSAYAGTYTTTVTIAIQSGP